MERIDPDKMTDQEIDKLIQDELNYRRDNGDIFQADENMCGYCRNIDKLNPFCWECDRGSKYVPVTFPLYNIILMFCSLKSGLENIENADDVDNKSHVLMQKGFIESLKFVVQPNGDFNETLKSFYSQIMKTEKMYNSPSEIENVKKSDGFIQFDATNEEKFYREEIGSIRTHEKACTHCKYKSRFETKFCWECDRGTNFRNGIRSVSTIYKMLMYINTSLGKDNNSHQLNEEYICMLCGFAEGLNWVIKPYTTEEVLIQERGCGYITKEDIELTIKAEDEEYIELDNYDN